MLATVVGVVVPVYLCIAGGYFWARIERPIDLSFVSAFVYVVGAPPLVYAAIKRVPDGSVPLGPLVEATVLALALGGLLAVLVSLAAGRYLGVSGRGLALPFAGAIGLAVLRNGFGEPGLAQGVVYFAVATIAAATLGRAAALGRWNASSIFGSPLGWALAAALALAALPGTPPKFVLNTTNLLGGLVVPVMLIAAGVALGRVSGPALLRALPFGIARIAVGVAVGIGVAELLALEHLSRAAVILETATPIAFLWPIYVKNGWAEFGASLAVGLAALPFVVLYVL